MTTNYRDDLGSGPPQGGGDSSGAKEQAQQAAGTAKEQARQTAGTAKQETQHVAGVAKDEAGRVAGEAREQVRGLIDEATTQVQQQSSQQKDRLAGTVRSFGEDLERMRSQGQTSGLAGQVVDQVSQSARDLAQRLEGREPAELLDDVRRFARQRPGSFLLGALAAGVVVGRLARGAKDAPSTNSGTDAGLATTTTPAAGTGGTAGLDQPTQKVAPIPPTDDDASPAFLSETETGRHTGSAADADPETSAGPTWTGTDTAPVADPRRGSGGTTGGAPL